MKLRFGRNRISFEKELNRLDEMAILFSECLSACGIRHVFLSGYVAIMFGRNRASEDIDVITAAVSADVFKTFWKKVHKKYECIITSDIRTAYDDYLCNGTAIRFAEKGEIIPNVEMKFAKNRMHEDALRSPVDVVINKRRIPISPLEQQIAYKLYMGSEKDIEDARFLFRLFEVRLDKPRLSAYLRILKVPSGKAKRYLGWSC